MARTVKEEEYALKRNEILDGAKQLMYTKGYEQMTIQDILDALQVSKGAFYHYFRSKQEVLEALIERLQDERDHVLLPIVHDPHLFALEKLQSIFDTLVSWKTVQKTFLLALWRVLYADENALFQRKWRAAALKRVSPLLAHIIREGIEQGVLTATHPEQSGEVILSMMLDLSETLGDLFSSSELDHQVPSRILNTVSAYTEALERVLGVTMGSLQLVDVETLQEWFALSANNREGRN